MCFVKINDNTFSKSAYKIAGLQLSKKMKVKDFRLAIQVLLLIQYSFFVMHEYNKNIE